MAEQGRDLLETSPSVQAHLGILQGVIQRMASNSAGCKTWSVSMASAMLVIVADKGKPNFALLALIPTLLFMGLDLYYLGLEKSFRESYNDFIRKLHTGTLTPADLFSVSPSGDVGSFLMKSLYDSRKDFSNPK